MGYGELIMSDRKVEPVIDSSDAKENTPRLASLGLDRFHLNEDEARWLNLPIPVRPESLKIP